MSQVELQGDDVSRLRDQAMKLLTFRHWKLLVNNLKKQVHKSKSVRIQVPLLGSPHKSLTKEPDSSTELGSESSAERTPNRSSSTAEASSSEASRLFMSPSHHHRLSSSSPGVIADHIHSITSRTACNYLSSASTTAVDAAVSTVAGRRYASPSDVPRPPDVFDSSSITFLSPVTNSKRSSRASTVTTRAMDYLFSSSLKQPSALTKREVAQQLLQHLGALAARGHLASGRDFPRSVATMPATMGSELKALPAVSPSHFQTGQAGRVNISSRSQQKGTVPPPHFDVQNYS
jgi:hypothetical protein